MKRALAALLLALPALAGEPARVVFEGGGERLEVPASALADVAMLDRGQGLTEVRFALAADDSERFAAMTGRLVGETLTIEICDRIVAEPTVMLPIEGGQVAVTGGTDLMAELFAALGSGRDCPEPGS